MSKYCVLPGHTPVRLTSIDGPVVIIGEEPRDIPEQFILQARAAGCLTELELEALKTSPVIISGTDSTNPDDVATDLAVSVIDDGAADPVVLDSEDDGFSGSAPQPNKAAKKG
jgi:hypothetical protein